MDNHHLIKHLFTTTILLWAAIASLAEAIDPNMSLPISNDHHDQNANHKAMVCSQAATNSWRMDMLFVFNKNIYFSLETVDNGNNNKTILLYQFEPPVGRISVVTMKDLFLGKISKADIVLEVDISTSPYLSNRTRSTTVVIWPDRNDVFVCHQFHVDRINGYPPRLQYNDLFVYQILNQLEIILHRDYHLKHPLVQLESATYNYRKRSVYFLFKIRSISECLLLEYSFVRNKTSVGYHLNPKKYPKIRTSNDIRFLLSYGWMLLTTFQDPYLYSLDMDSLPYAFIILYRIPWWDFLQCKKTPPETKPETKPQTKALGNSNHEKQMATIISGLKLQWQPAILLMVFIVALFLMSLMFILYGVLSTEPPISGSSRTKSSEQPVLNVSNGNVVVIKLKEPSNQNQKEVVVVKKQQQPLAATKNHHQNKYFNVNQNLLKTMRTMKKTLRSLSGRSFTFRSSEDSLLSDDPITQMPILSELDHGKLDADNFLQGRFFMSKMKD